MIAPRGTIVEKTVREAFDALVEDGFNHIREAWIQQNGQKISGCLLGITGLNLGVAPTSHFAESGYSNNGLMEQLNRFTSDGMALGSSDGMALGSYLVTKNDSRLDKDEFEAIYGGGSDDNYAEFPENDDRRYRYSWNELVELARTAMTPHFDKVMQLEVFDVSFGLPKLIGG